MSAECGQGLIVSSLMSAGAGSGRGAWMVRGNDSGARGDVLVGAWSMTSVISVGTVAGVTFSTMAKAGNRRTVVGSE